MPDNELEALRADIADMRRQYDRIEAEHRTLLRVYEEATASRQKLRDDTDQTLKLFSDYWDERLKQRIATGGGDETLAALLPEFMRDAVQFVYRVAEQTELRIMERVSIQVERLYDLNRKVFDVIEVRQ